HDGHARAASRAGALRLAGPLAQRQLALVALGGAGLDLLRRQAGLLVKLALQGVQPDAARDLAPRPLPFLPDRVGEGWALLLAALARRCGPEAVDGARLRLLRRLLARLGGLPLALASLLLLARVLRPFEPLEPLLLAAGRLS